MSAIVAILRLDGEPVDPDGLERMLTAGSHRAVDGQDTFIDGAIALAHQHFWVTPEEQGELQPLVDNESGLVITCDARLDNRDELCGALGIDKSRRLSDAELALSAYKKWDSECARHLLGDFAFMIWDRENQQLYLARDGLGVRDLCYYQSGNMFVAASEPKQVAAHPQVPGEMNEAKVGEYLLSRWTDQESTFYEDVFFWTPGREGTISASGMTRRTFWQIDPGGTSRLSDEGEYAEAFRELLTSSVRNRARIAGRPGISLSGGPDSAALAALYSSMSSQPARSFSYVFDQCESCDEREYIQPVVSELGLDATFINGDGLWPLGDVDNWPVYPDFAGQDPFVRLPLTVVDHAAESGCRVVFNGHYSDVLFAGGQAWSVELLREFRVMEFLRLYGLSRNKSHSLKQLARQAVAIAVPDYLKRRLTHRLSSRTRTAGGVPDHLSRGFLERNALPARRAPQPAESRSPRTRAMRAAQLTSAIEPQGSSAFRSLSNRKGVEYIDPFWDRRLVEFIMTMPAYVLGRPPYPKWLLRQSMADHVPHKVLFRANKTSLYGLFQAGLTRHERGNVLNLLEDPQVLKAAIIDPQWLRSELDQLRRKRSRYEPGHALWHVLCLELWLRRYWS